MAAIGFLLQVLSENGPFYLKWPGVKTEPSYFQSVIVTFSDLDGKNWHLLLLALETDEKNKPRRTVC